jgi:two-component system phosphate regulon response regulator PhoB
VVKPFSVKELSSGCGPWRDAPRSGAPPASAPTRGSALAWRGLEVDPVRHRVYVDGGELVLRPMEFKLILTFLDAPGKVFSREELLEVVWGIDADVNTRTVASA